MFFANLWRSLKKIVQRIVLLFGHKKKKKIIPKISILEDSIRKTLDEIKKLSSLKEFYKNDPFYNDGQIKELEGKISLLRQEMFAKNRELRREVSKENLKRLKMR